MFTAKTITFDNMPGAISEILNRIESIEANITSIQQQQQQSPSVIDPEPYVYGIKGLASLLNVSAVTAQKIKNSGRIPFSQAERTLVFRKQDVLDALSSTVKKKGVLMKK